MDIPNLKAEFNGEFFDDDPNISLNENKRKTTRYVRKDIKVALRINNVFGIKKMLDSELLDISSNGALVFTRQTLRLKQKVIMLIEFIDGKTFSINAEIVRKCASSKYHYGIKFEKRENTFGEYLLETQTDLIFK